MKKYTSVSLSFDMDNEDDVDLYNSIKDLNDKELEEVLSKGLREISKVKRRETVNNNKMGAILNKYRNM